MITCFRFLRPSLLLAFALAAPCLQAQSSETSMKPILTQVEPRITAIQNAGNTIVRMEMDLVHKKRPKETYRKLFSSRTYTIEAFGDTRRIEDVDLVIYKKTGDNWTALKKDQTAKSEAKLVFTPEENDYYKIEISVYKFKGDYEVGHYGLIIHHE